MELFLKQYWSNIRKVFVTIAVWYSFCIFAGKKNNNCYYSRISLNTVAKKNPGLKTYNLANRATSERETLKNKIPVAGICRSLKKICIITQFLPSYFLQRDLPEQSYFSKLTTSVLISAEVLFLAA